MSRSKRFKKSWVKAKKAPKPQRHGTMFWLERDDAALRFTLSMLNELAAQKTLDYPTASVAVQRLAQLAWLP